MQKLPDRPFIAPPSGLGPEGSINNAGCHVNYMGTLPRKLNIGKFFHGGS
jgi:hypothetical protein